MAGCEVQSVLVRCHAALMIASVHACVGVLHQCRVVMLQVPVSDTFRPVWQRSVCD